LEQGVRRVDTSLVLLLDADIQLESGVIADLMRVMQKRQVQMVSVMATLQMVSFWESVLNPAFIYFFKMLYPFGLSNSANPHFAAAAGGCILLRADLFDSIGGLQSMRSALIDDCTLAQKVKAAGFRTWTGVSRRVISARPYTSLNEIWKMVARSAFTQLRYSMLLLLVCTLMMLILFWAPVLGLLSASYATRSLSLIAWLGMTIAYLPTLKYYQRNLAWALMLPLIGGLYLLMTWDSALRYWRGERSQWKGRVYHH
jgi:hopene-associated glycosyltransferase HpnB